MKWQRPRSTGSRLLPSTLNRVENLDQLLMNARRVHGEPGTRQAVCGARGTERRPRAESAASTVDPPRPRGRIAQQRRSGGWRRSAAARATGQPGRSASRRTAGLLSQVRRAGGLSPRRERSKWPRPTPAFTPCWRLSDGSLMLEDARYRSGPAWSRSRASAPRHSGRCACAPIAADGAAGRLGSAGDVCAHARIQGIALPAMPSAKPCMLSGTDLFLAASFASTLRRSTTRRMFRPQFTGTQLVVPHPVNGVLYLKLRDDPATVQTLTLPVTPVALPVQKLPSEIAAGDLSAGSRAAGTPSAPSPAETVPAAKPEPGTNEPSSPSAPPTTPEATPPAQSNPATKPGPAATQPSASPAKTNPVGNPAPVASVLSTGSAPAAVKPCKGRPIRARMPKRLRPPPN